MTLDLRVSWHLEVEAAAAWEAVAAVEAVLELERRTGMANCGVKWEVHCLHCQVCGHLDWKRSWCQVHLLLLHYHFVGLALHLKGTNSSWELHYSMLGT